MNKEPITVEGLENLKIELENLKNVQRPKVVAAIADAHSLEKVGSEKSLANEERAKTLDGVVVEITAKVSDEGNL